MPDLSFVFAQSLSGLTAAMFLFLIASGLSLIFGVLRVLNFAHGTFYMLGAYAAYQFVQWLGVGGGSSGWPRSAQRWRWPPSAGSSSAAFRHLYGKEELYQLLFTYALVLILSDGAKMIWGTQQKSVSRPPGLTGSFTCSAPPSPTTTCSSSCWARPSRWRCGSCCSARGWDASSAPPRSTARRSARSASTSTRSTPGCS